MVVSEENVDFDFLSVGKADREGLYGRIPKNHIPNAMISFIP